MEKSTRPTIKVNRSENKNGCNQFKRDCSRIFAVAASPGLATLAVALVSMSSSRKNGIRYGIALSVGLAFWGVVAAAGLGLIYPAFSRQ